MLFLCFNHVLFLMKTKSTNALLFLSDWSSIPQMDAAWNPLKRLLLSMWSHLWLRHAGEVMHQLWNDFSEISLREIHQHVELKLTKKTIYWILSIFGCTGFWFLWQSPFFIDDTLEYPIYCIRMTVWCNASIFLLYTDHVLICEVDRLLYFLNDVYIYVVSKMTFFVINHKKMSFLI